ncbi:hypothetical protein O6H91_06G101300 [Diphasiastrum complanatum]|uniref:Uncharacterized protein n=1 Tax=Diphasiastrum complanatum TaxID=34168 RepID=A0ACC2DGQ4_DIPCM|nr:hypothetical protein O6H91_06G101300 [Diphasiastrum complanatum]
MNFMTKATLIHTTSKDESFQMLSILAFHKLQTAQEMITAYSTFCKSYPKNVFIHFLVSSNDQANSMEYLAFIFQKSHQSDSSMTSTRLDTREGLRPNTGEADNWSGHLSLAGTSVSQVVREAVICDSRDPSRQ